VASSTTTRTCPLCTVDALFHRTDLVELFRRPATAVQNRSVLLFVPVTRDRLENGALAGSRQPDDDVVVPRPQFVHEMRRDLPPFVVDFLLPVQRVSGAHVGEPEACPPGRDRVRLLLVSLEKVWAQALEPF
jgi:hypothetical protein